MPALCLPAVIVLLLVPPPASTNVLPRRNRQTDNLSHRIASAVELYRDTTRTAVIDFSDGLLDWDDVWDTNYGADDFKRYYRVSSLAGGYLIRDHRNRYSETPRNYLEEQIRHITKHYSNAGFWDPSRGFWIGRLDWTPESGWEACPFHFWRFSVELQEGALMAAMARSCEPLDSCLAGEAIYLHTRINADGAIHDLPLDEYLYEYGLVLSAQSLAALYFHNRLEPHPADAEHGADWSAVSSIAREDAARVFQYLARAMKETRFVPPVPTESLAVLLRGFVNAWRLFNRFGDIEKRAVAEDHIVSLSRSFSANQLPSGLFDISHHTASYPVQVQLKADIALMLRHEILPDPALVSAVENNMEWIHRNRWDRSEKYMDALEWSSTDTTNYFECHQMWYLIASTYLDEHSPIDYSGRRARVFAFLTDDNSADVDMYLHNRDTYGAFFAYRAISRDGTIQKDAFHRWKAAYEIGASLWGMALNYDLFAEGRSHLLTQCPPGSCASWETALFLGKSVPGGKFVMSWDVAFRDVSFAGAMTGLCGSRSGDWRILLGTGAGLRYRNEDQEEAEAGEVPLLDSGVTYTLQIAKLGERLFACSLYDGLTLLHNSVIDDVAPSDSLFFVVYQCNGPPFDARNISVDNIRYSAVEDIVMVQPPVPYEAYPNPFRGETIIEFPMARGGFASLNVFNASGARVRRLLGTAMPSGNIQITWDGKDDRGNKLPSGIYFLKLRAPGIADSKKLVILR